MSCSDRQLAQACQHGEASAFAELVRRHRRMVYGVAYAILASTDDAEDVVQEAFLRAHQAMAQFNSRCEFAAWIRRIAVNCAISKLRQRQRIARLARDGATSANPGPEPSPAESLAAGELDDRVRRAIAELPLKQRLAITLFGLQDLNLAETAEALGCSVGAVKLHLHRARRKLADMLSDYLEEA